MGKRTSVVLILLGAVLLLFGCRTVSGEQDQKDALAYLDVSSHPSNVYVGLSGPYSTQERMVEEAILSAAKSIQLKKALALDSRLVTSYQSDKGLLSFASDEAAFYDDTTMAETIRSLDVLSVHFDPEAGAIVIVQDPRESGKKRVYQSSYTDEGKPTWITTYPKVEGYQFGVGSAKRHYFLNDSLEAADFAAAQNLLDLKTEHAFSVEKVTTANQQMESHLYQAQRGLLKGFTIIARYYDRASQTYWSLACADE
ncbi:MAG: hypothetical protein VB127_11815 [Sphaerochaeta sp.]|nr:hypothetical protein [Sphaerochaeta sp.]